MDRPPLVTLRGFHVRSGRKSLVHPTDLSLAEGEWKAVIGPNGAGKTSLLKAIATLMPGEGELLFRGRPVKEGAAAYRRRIGVVTHESMLYRELTARENLAFYARLYGVPEERALERLAEVGLATVSHEPVGRFSRGMVQRLAIARALLHDPCLLLLDEPLTGIDAQGARAMIRLFAEAKERGIAGLWVTHQWERAWGLVDAMIEIERGRVVAETPTRGLDPAEWRPVHAAVGVEG